MKSVLKFTQKFKRYNSNAIKELLEDTTDLDKKMKMALFIGTNSLRRSKYQEAKEYLKLSQQISIEKADKETEVQSLKHLAQAFFENEEYVDSFKLFQQLYEKTKDEKHTLMKDYALIKLGEVSKALRNYFNSKNYFEAALKSNQTQIQALAYQNLAILQMEDNKLDEALELIEKTLSIPQDESIESKSMILKGVLLSKQGKKEEGLFLIKQGSNFVIAANDKSLSKFVTKLLKDNNIHFDLERQKIKNEQLEEFKKPTFVDLLEELRVSLAENTKLPGYKMEQILHYKQSLFKKANDLFANGEYAYAIDYYEILLEIIEIQQNYDQDAFEVIQNLAESFVKVKKYHKAIKYYEILFNILGNYGDDKNDQYLALVEIGKCFYLMKDFENSKHFLEVVLRSSPISVHLALAHEYLSLIHLENKNYHLAEDHLNHSIAQFKELNNQEKIKKLEKRLKYIQKDYAMDRVILAVPASSEKAEILFNKVLGIIQESFNNDFMMLIDAYTTFLLKLIEEKEYLIAKNIVSLVLKIQSENDTPNEVKKLIFDLASTIFNQMEDHENALYFYEFSYQLEPVKTIQKLMKVGKMALLAKNRDKMKRYFDQILDQTSNKQIVHDITSYKMILGVLQRDFEKARKHYNRLDYDIDDFGKFYYRMIITEIEVALEDHDDRLLKIFEKIEFKIILEKQLTTDDFTELFTLIKNPKLKEHLIENGFVKNQ